MTGVGETMTVAIVEGILDHGALMYATIGSILLRT